MGKFEDLTGQKFGRFTVIERTPNKCKRTMWLCECDCIDKTKCIVSATNLKSGHSKSCGCIEREKSNNRKHGMTRTRIYAEWQGMKQRCSNKNADSYRFYGARGIAVCAEWQEFEPFYNWALNNGYKEHLTLDRINCNGNYEPSNCRWITMKAQQRNRRSNHNLTYNGETHTIAEWAEITGINQGTITRRINVLNWSIERALTEKPFRCKNQSFKGGDEKR